MSFKGFIVSLNTPHYVTKFNEIDGVYYDVETEDEVLEKLEDYIEYMKEESEMEGFSFHIINIQTGQANLHTYKAES